ncbi:unnamed protein product [Heligmosomoides polygyrus]|uniref:Uncharacterized protein n=1 Tax=Heligmosomoides polygyrus TaxID=6339 RepID=A0A183GAS6_HELPZ|nr:unnamed protein product [Heligmosomoides polygyrus]
MVHEAVVFLIDVVPDGIFPKADKGGVEVPVDGRSGIPLLGLRGLLLDAKSETSREGGGGPILCRTWRQRRRRSGILAIEDDVVDLVVELAAGGFPGPS